jgi:hypothetical protein
MSPEAPTAVRALGALIEAYVGFARDHPAHIHLMLRGELVEDCQREGSAPPGDPEPLGLVGWSY